MPAGRAGNKVRRVVIESAFDCWTWWTRSNRCGLRNWQMPMESTGPRDGCDVRHDVQFEVDGDVMLRGCLLVPDGPGPHAGITMANGNAGVMTNLRYKRLSDDVCRHPRPATHGR
jgi:hypothetical protein